MLTNFKFVQTKKKGQANCNSHSNICSVPMERDQEPLITILTSKKKLSTTAEQTEIIKSCKTDLAEKFNLASCYNSYYTQSSYLEPVGMIFLVMEVNTDSCKDHRRTFHSVNS